MNENVTTMTDEELANLANTIRENLAETGLDSSYAYRNRPVLRRAEAEARRRGLDLK